MTIYNDLFTWFIELINILNSHYIQTKYSYCTHTVSPWQEAMWFITEGGLPSEFTSHSLYGENFFQITDYSGLWVKHSISLSMFTYRPPLMGVGGLPAEFPNTKLGHSPVCCRGLRVYWVVKNMAIELWLQGRTTNPNESHTTKTRYLVFELSIQGKLHNMFCKKCQII